ncbi:MAG: biopolymer transporter ExbD [Candidatus Eisenbacteria bacterium]
MKFKRSLSVGAVIPTSSMADLVFLLLIFFMATTIFKMEEGLQITLPRAEAGVRIPREKTVHVWMNTEGEITIDDRFLALGTIPSVLTQKMRENPQLVVGLNLDGAIPFRRVNDMLTVLRECNAINVSFTNELEQL